MGRGRLNFKTLGRRAMAWHYQNLYVPDDQVHTVQKAVSIERPPPVETQVLVRESSPVIFNEAPHVRESKLDSMTGRMIFALFFLGAVGITILIFIILILVGLLQPGLGAS